MSREEVEKRLAQLMGNVALAGGQDDLPGQQDAEEDEALSLERLEIEDQLSVDSEGEDDVNSG